MQTKVILIASLIFFSFSFHAQNLNYSFTFDSNLQSWKSVSISNQGSWNWSQNGKADQGIYWNNRPPINNSSTGALVYDSDYLMHSGQGDPNDIYETAIVSPTLDFHANEEVFLKFNQYYRNYNSTTRLDISTDSGLTWNTIPLNNGININVETSPKDYEIIDLSAYAAYQAKVQIRFVFTGNYYFWILDDIMFYDGYPVIPTTPSYIGEYLTEHGYKYAVDPYGSPYIPNEIALDFIDGTTDAEKDIFKNKIGADLSETCVCDQLENWIIDESLLYGDVGLSSLGPQSGVDEQVMTSTSDPIIDNIDYNRYILSEQLEGGYTSPSIDQIIDTYNQSSNEDEIKVAIIDTGLDLLHEDLVDFINLSNDIIDGNDNDDNCYDDNVIGWNFVDNNNNASDDQGHGSHVAGIIASTSSLLNIQVPTILIPYKTHDFRGVANIFDVTCAMYLAIKDEVSVVNCSWGFFGNESSVLYDAITQAYESGITVIAASGNDALDLTTKNQYPACSKIPNIISVGSYSNSEEGDGEEFILNSPFSNYSPKYVDVLAPGVDILSTVPYNELEVKTGTSMAAPFVAAYAAYEYSIGNNAPESIKDVILDLAYKYEHLTPYVLDGNVLLSFEQEEQNNFYTNEESIEAPTESLIDVNCVKNENSIVLQFNSSESDVNLNLLNSQGKSLYNTQFSNIEQGDLRELELGKLPFGIYYLKLNDIVLKLIF